MVEKEGQQPVPRNTVGETTVDGEAEPVPVKLGVWLSNTNSRRDRLDADQLAALGVAWAGPVPDIEAAPAPFVQAAPPAAPPKQPVREHHEECNKMLYEGGLHLRPHRAAGTALRA